MFLRTHVSFPLNRFPFEVILLSAAVNTKRGSFFLFSNNFDKMILFFVLTHTHGHNVNTSPFFSVAFFLHIYASLFSLVVDAVVVAENNPILN